MLNSESIVYVEKDNKRRYKCDATSVYLLKELLVNGEVKIMYFEIFKNNRSAKARLKKMQSLDRLKLVEMIKNSNPEMLNLANCI